MNAARRLLRRIVPSAVRKPVAEGLISLHNYRRARRVLGVYSQHYAEARRRYQADGQPVDLAVASLVDVGVRRLAPGSSSNVINLPPDYLDLVARIAQDADRRFALAANCAFFPPLGAPARVERTEDVEEIRERRIITMQLVGALVLDGLETLCAALVPEVERRVYGSYALVDKIYVYRSPVSQAPPRASWLWHYDEHPLEVLKLMIYLTDVEADTAPFTYLAKGDPPVGVLGTRNPLYGQSRISAERMDAYAARGCHPVSVTGPRGTAVLFNDNVVHRATLAERRHRDVLTLQLRPADVRRTPYVDPRWTGSFPHRDFNRDPRAIAPQVWPP